MIGQGQGARYSMDREQEEEEEEEGGGGGGEEGEVREVEPVDYRPGTGDTLLHGHQH